MEIFKRDFDRTPLAMLNRLIPQWGRLWASIFRISRVIGQCEIPANLWIIENAKYLIDDRFHLLDQREHHPTGTKRKDVLQLLLEATNAKKVCS